MMSDVQRFVRLYERIAHIPIVKSAWILQGSESPVVSCVHERDDPVEGTKIDTFQNYFPLPTPRAKHIGELEEFGPCVLTRPEICRVYSDSRRKLAIFSRNKGAAKDYVQIWGEKNCNQLLSSLCLDDFSKSHGRVYTEPDVKSLQWSPNDEYLLYVAEPSKPKAVSFFQKKESDGDVSIGEEYRFKDNFGEKLAEVTDGRICILRVSDFSVRVLPPLPDELFPQHVIWDLEGRTLYGVALETKPYRLGLYACPMRRTGLFKANIDKVIQGWDSEDKSSSVKDVYEILHLGKHRSLDAGQTFRSLRAVPGGQHIVFIQEETGGTHMKTAELIRYDLQSGEIKCLISRSVSPPLALYGSCIPPGRCFYRLKNSGGDLAMVLNTAAKSHSVSFAVNLDTGAMVEGTLKQVFAEGFQILDVDPESGMALLKSSSPSVPPRLHLLPSVDTPPPCFPRAAMWRVDVEKITLPSAQEKAEAILLRPSGHKEIVATGSEKEDDTYSFKPRRGVPPSAPLPLIAFPHGGPHVHHTTDFSRINSVFLGAGYAILLLNYRGSTSFGEPGVRSLPGKIGSLDVDDCHQLVLRALDENKGVLDPENVYLFGGSHGGFLSLQLASQHPDHYKAVSVRNPVTDLPAMEGVTDIPDWLYVEGLSKAWRSTGHKLTPEELAKMADVSPRRNFSKIESPVLFLLGKKDLRVPISQGLKAYKLLKAQGTITECITYDDNHSLAEVPVAADLMVHSLIWFDKYRNF